MSKIKSPHTQQLIEYLCKFHKQGMRILLETHLVLTTSESTMLGSQANPQFLWHLRNLYNNNFIILYNNLRWTQQTERNVCVFIQQISPMHLIRLFCAYQVILEIPSPVAYYEHCPALFSPNNAADSSALCPESSRVGLGRVYIQTR